MTGIILICWILALLFCPPSTQKALFILGCWGITLLFSLPRYVGDKQARHALLIKWLGTFSAAVMGIGGGILHGGAAWLCAAGLFICALADVVLEKKFNPGMACFATGHVCYVAWFLQRMPLGVGHVVAFALFFSVALVTIHRWTGIFRREALPLTAYALFLSAMGACGAAGAGRGLSGLLIAMGAVLFVASDMMVYRGRLKPWSRRMDFVAMGIYYVAQLFFGTACLLG